jgi:hypothetical protein
MKIVPIFASKLFAFHYDNESQDEYARLLDLWNDPEYVYEYAVRNEVFITKSGFTAEEFAQCILSDVENLEELLLAYKNAKNPIDACFQPLHDQESGCKILSLQKKKCKFLRLYAIRIETNCFVITGGAIKVTRTIQGHIDTMTELTKLNKCKSYLQSQGIFDTDSFFEIIGE